MGVKFGEPKKKSANIVGMIPLINAAIKAKQLENAQAEAQTMNPYEALSDEQKPHYLPGTPEIGMSGPNPIMFPFGKKLNRRKIIPPTMAGNIAGYKNSIEGFKDILSTVASDVDIHPFLSPTNVSSWDDALGNLALQFQNKTNNPAAQKFGAFKSKTANIFQKFLYSHTGTQRGFREIVFFKPIFPQPTDPPNLFMAKTLALISQTRQNLNLMLKELERSGYDVSDSMLDANNYMNPGNIENVVLERMTKSGIDGVNVQRFMDLAEVSKYDPNNMEGEERNFSYAGPPQAPASKNKRFDSWNL